MAGRRKIRDSAFKAKVALEALKERETVNQLAKRFVVHATQIHSWKKQLLAQAAAIFERDGSQPVEAVEPVELYEQIGRLKVELEFLKKKASQFGGG